ncbi:hypothetical protein BC826DRAFT_1112392 [Russula brevipes]|nr:hypothetical protein BC826DRAFT_1112392 [Russula brevipes]
MRGGRRRGGENAPTQSRRPDAVPTPRRSPDAPTQSRRPDAVPTPRRSPDAPTQSRRPDTDTGAATSGDADAARRRRQCQRGATPTPTRRDADTDAIAMRGGRRQGGDDAPTQSRRPDAVPTPRRSPDAPTQSRRPDAVPTPRRSPDAPTQSRRPDAVPTPRHRHGGGDERFDPSLDLGAKCPLNSVFNEKLVLGKLGEFVQAETSNVKGPSKKRKKLSYKDEITIPIRRDGHRIILEPEYLRQEQARVQQEELPYFWNLIQAAKAALGDDPELEPSWTSISQSNQEWFASEYLPIIWDIYGEEKQVHI